MGAWAFMFAEIVAYSQSRVDSVSDLEARCAFKPGLGDADSCRLSSLGYDAGQRLLPLLLLRNTQASGIKVRSTIPSIFVSLYFSAKHPFRNPKENTALFLYSSSSIHRCIAIALAGPQTVSNAASRKKMNVCRHLIYSNSFFSMR